MRTLQLFYRTVFVLTLLAFATQASDARAQAVISAELETSGDLVPGSTFDILFSISANDTGQTPEGMLFELAFDPASVSYVGHSTVSYPVGQQFSVTSSNSDGADPDGVRSYRRFALINPGNTEDVHPLYRATFEVASPSPDSPFSIEFRPALNNPSGSQVLLDSQNDSIPYVLDMGDITGVEIPQTDFALVSTVLPGGAASIIAGKNFDVELTLESINVPEAGGVELAVTYDSRSVELLSAGSGDLGNLTLGPIVSGMGHMVSRTVTAENAANTDDSISLGLLSFYVVVPTREPFDIVVGATGDGPAVVETDLSTPITSAFDSSETRDLTAQDEGVAILATSIDNVTGGFYTVGTTFDVPVVVSSNTTGEAPTDAFFRVVYDSDIVILSSVTPIAGFGTLEIGIDEVVDGSIIAKNISVTGGTNTDQTPGVATLGYEVISASPDAYSITIGNNPDADSPLENSVGDAIATGFNNNATLNFPFDGDDPDSAVIQTVVAGGNPNATDSDFDVLVRVGNNPTGIVPIQASIVLTYDTQAVQFIDLAEGHLGGFESNIVPQPGSTVVDHRISTVGGENPSATLVPAIATVSFRTQVAPLSPYDIIVSADGPTPLLGEPDNGNIPSIPVAFNSDQTINLGPEGCFFITLDPVVASIDADGGALAFDVNTSGTFCLWTAESNDPWITVTSGLSRTGSGTVELTVAANVGGARTGTVTVTGDTADGSVSLVFTVDQEAGCITTLDPTFALIPVDGASSSFDIVLNEQECEWMAVANDAWITIDSADSGTGDDTVSYTVAASTEDFPRVGTITVNDAVFTITQEGRCEYTVEPLAVIVGAAGGSSSVDVATSEEDCTWSAVSNDTWITITSGDTGEGAGSVEFDVAANDGPEREGTLTVAGQTVTVTQLSGCSLMLDPQNVAIPAGGGSSSFDVTTSDPDCPWTVMANAPWITITSVSAGTGDATVQFDVAENPNDASRIGTISVNTRTFTIFQAGQDDQNIAVIAGSVSGGNPDQANSEFTILLSVIANDTGIVPDSASVSVTFDPNSVEYVSIADEDLGQTLTNEEPEVGGDGLHTLNFVAVGGDNPAASMTPSIATLTFRTIDQPLAPYSILFDDSTRPGSITLIGAAPAFETIPAIFVNDGTENLGGTECFFIALSDNSADVGAEGDSISFDVLTSGVFCEWTAVSNDAFITVVSGDSGTGNGAVQLDVAANPGVVRTGTVTVSGNTINGPVSLTFTVNQEDGCEFVVSPTNFSVAEAAGSITVNIDASGDSCAWSASSNNAFLTIAGPSSGVGSATLTVNVAANTGPARPGTLTVAGVTVTVNQADGCTFSINPTSANVGPTGGIGNIELTASNEACPWTATASEAWVTITSGSSGTGDGTVNYTVAANTGLERTATITVQGEVHTITQADGCALTLAAESLELPSEGGDSSFSITASNEACAWTVSVDSAAVTITSPTSGSGNGTVDFTVAANNTFAARSIVFTVNDETITFTQESGCEFTVSPLALEFPAEGGDLTIEITANDEVCAWSITSGIPWLSFDQTEGEGDAVVTVTASANNSNARQGTVTVAGQTVNVSQASGCSFTLNPTAASFEPGEDSGEFTVTASDSGCSWSATTTASWITITSPVGSVTGNGTVSYSITANDDLPRTGTIVVGDAVFTITQQGELENIYASLIDERFFVGYSDLNNGLGDSVFRNVSGAIEGEIATSDGRGNMTVLNPDLTVDNRGRIHGWMEMVVTDANGNVVASREIPANGRIHYNGLINENISPLPENALLISSGMEVRNRVAISGQVRGLQAGRTPSGPSSSPWAFRLAGTEEFTMTSVNGVIGGPVGVIGFQTGLQTVVGSRQSRGASDVLIRGWFPDTGQFAITRGSEVAVNHPRTRWLADAPVLLFANGGIDAVVPGGQTELRVRYFDQMRDRPGRYRLRQTNDIYRSQSAGFLGTSSAHASLPAFGLPDMTFYPTQTKFQTPAANNRVRTQWDPTLLIMVTPSLVPLEESMEE